MNDLDKIYEEAAEQLTKARYSGELHFQALAVNLIKSACEKATERKNSEMKKMNDLWERLHKQLGTEPDDDWDEAPFNYIERLQFPEPTQSRAAHASDENLPCPTCGRSVPDSMLEKIAKAVLQEPAHRVEKDAAGASDDNCRKCGRPLGWFEPGLCDNCRAVHAGKPKPLERCSSNPHYEAHFGDEPATTAHASEQP